MPKFSSLNRIGVPQANYLIETESPTVVDTRDAVKFRDSTLAGAVHIPLSAINQYITHLPTCKTTKILLIGEDNTTSMQDIELMAKYLIQLGYNRLHLVVM